MGRVPDAANRLAVDPELRREFEVLVQEWRYATRFQSNVTAIVEHWAYRQIVAMGPPALPLILAELARSVDHWFIALHEIVGTDVAAVTTTMGEAAMAWVEWGRQKGYLDASALQRGRRRRR